MYRLLLFLSISWEVIHSTRGQATNIKGVFTKGDVKFTWTPDNANVKSESVTVYRQSGIAPTPWIDVTNRGTYTQKDILNYTKIAIIIQTYFTDNRDPIISERYETFKIPNVIKIEPGEDKEIKIPLDFFPATGGYSIKNDDKNIVLFNVQGNITFSENTSRYIYVSESTTEPKSITIKIKSVTTEDAGYIFTSAGDKKAQNGPGVVLVVTGSPTKPTIAGKDDVPVGEEVILTCESESTSAPSYYKMLPPLTYTWYRNGSKITEQTSKQWRYKAEKIHKYDTITCKSREETDSELSEPFKLDPQYGPDTVNISPEIPDTVDVVEGKKFGPYTCSSDCNPPCRYQWKRHISESRYDNVGSGPIFTISKVNKTHANKYRCRVDSSNKNSNGLTKATKTVTLRVLYLSEPVFYTNNSIMETTKFDEKGKMNLSCKVEGIPRSSVSILRNRKSLSFGNEWSNYTFAKGLHCEDTGNYTCTGKSSRFNQTEKSFFMEVLCSTRVDVASSPRLLYGSQIGQAITVIMPVISNPKPKNPAWSKPADADTRIETEIKQGSVVYRHQIESKIYIKKQSDFGNYTLFVERKPLTTITINAEGPPFTPSNFSGISEIQGQINLTWISTFNGGPEQFFLLKQKINSEWEPIENISDIGQGRQMSVVVERTVEPGGTYEFMLQSCNRIDCSDVIKSAPIKAQEIPTKMEDTGSSGSTIAIAVSSVAVVIVLVAVLAGMLFKIKRKSQEKTPTGIPYTPPEVVYATVDKGNVNNATIKGGIPANTKETNDTGEPENMYANTNETIPIVKKSKPERPANPPKKKKKLDKKKKAEETTSTPNNTSRTVNEDGLIYIDVDFAKTPQETQDPPVIHGEEDRTEYTFVDFSKKAPPIEDTSSDEQNEEKKDDV